MKVSKLPKSHLAHLSTSAGQIASAQYVPVEDTVNREGCPAYALPDELRLLSMLNTVKLEPQYYRNPCEAMKEMQELVERIASTDPYFVAQAIVYSRCIRDGMRSINHLAAACLAPFASKQEWAKRFYSLFNKKEQKGGCIYRVDDMSEIKDVYSALTDNKPVLSNAMKKGFKSVLEHLDTYQLAKYKKSVIDIANLVHPSPFISSATIDLDGEPIKTLSAIMQGLPVSADTWEVAQSAAGQEVAKAVKEGKLSEKEAQEVLAEAKNDNWEALLSEGKLGILAALRNLRNMLKEPRKKIIDQVCALISNGDLIRKGKIMPYQIDYAYETVKCKFSGPYATQVLHALQKGYEDSIPNLAEAMPGKTCVMVDCSGSMIVPCHNGNSRNTIQSTAAQKAGLIAATIAKATGADVVRFGSHATFFTYDPFDSVFSLGRRIGEDNMGGTDIPAAFNLITVHHRKYDRIILLSDNECNLSLRSNWVSGALRTYIREVANPYVYAVDLAAYGTVPVKGDNVNYYFGYGTALFDDIASKEFNPMQHIEAVRKVVI